MIIKKYQANRIEEGAGVIVNRVFGHGQVEDFDPFLMLDYFDHEDTMSSPGFPWHPHKGIETISYILRGSIEHEDTLGNKGVIRAGELQWMTAGKGIKHQEMPVKSPQGLEGFQFWVNLPKAKKLVEPSYQYMTSETLKSVHVEESEVRVVSGTYLGMKGPIEKEDLGIQMLYLKTVKENIVEITRDEDKNGFIFVTKGNGLLNDEKIEANHAYTLSPGTYNINGDLDLMFAQGIPLKEPVAWYGPIVMNTKEELVKTFKDLEEGTF